MHIKCGEQLLSNIVNGLLQKQFQSMTLLYLNWKQQRTSEKISTMNYEQNQQKLATFLENKLCTWIHIHCEYGLLQKQFQPIINWAFRKDFNSLWIETLDFFQPRVTSETISTHYKLSLQKRFQPIVNLGSALQCMSGRLCHGRCYGSYAMVDYKTTRRHQDDIKTTTKWWTYEAAQRTCSLKNWKIQAHL